MVQPTGAGRIPASLGHLRLAVRMSWFRYGRSVQLIPKLETSLKEANKINLRYTRELSSVRRTVVASYVGTYAGESA